MHSTAMRYYSGQYNQLHSHNGYAQLDKHREKSMSQRETLLESGIKSSQAAVAYGEASRASSHFGQVRISGKFITG